jgi:Tfp pilus assembly major pilin PilA
MAQKAPVPSWLTEDNINAVSTAAKNPVVQDIAVKSAYTAAMSPAATFNSIAVAIDNLTSGGGSAKQQKFEKLDSESSHGDTVAHLNLPPEEIAEINAWSKKLRQAYIVISVIMSLAAFFSLGSNDLAVVFIALYVWFFSCLIFCFELALTVVAKLIAENFGFMYNIVNRSIFLFMVTIMCFELGFIGKLVMIMLFCASVVSIYVAIKHPAYEEYLRRSHYYKLEDRVETSKV